MRRPLLATALVLSALLHGTAEAESQQNLLDIYQLALSNDPGWASARSGNLAAQEKLVQGKALFWPTIAFNSSASRSETDIRYIGNNGGNPFRTAGEQRFDTFAYGLSINQPIFRKQNNVQYNQARIQVTQADKQLIQAQQGLMLRTAQAYFDVLLAQDKITLIEAQKAAIQHQLEQAQANFDAGTGTITDVNESRARYDLTLAQEVAARNELEVKKRAVQAITSQLPQQLASVRDDIHPILPQPNDMEAWVELAQQNNLNLIIQQQNYEFASEEVERQNAGHLPTLDAVGSYTDTRANGSANGFGSDLQNATIGLQLQIPIFQGGAVSSRVREALANKQKALDDVEAAKRQSDLGARESYLNLVSSVAQVQAYEQALRSSQSQLDSSNLGFEVGIRTSVDVLNAQQQYYSARRDLLQSRYSYLLSILKLKSAVGLLSEADLDDINQRLLLTDNRGNTP